MTQGRARKFRTVTLDPPWLERGSGKVKRGADRHYPLMKTKDMPTLITAAPVWSFHEHAHCYMWVTNNFLPDGLWLMDQLGFVFKTTLCWKKPRIGIGQYFRGQHELVLFGTRGKGMDSSVYTGRRDVSSMIDANHGFIPGTRSRKHSAKPLEFYDKVEARSHGPYLEMFAREPRKGWTSWGNEVNHVG